MRNLKKGALAALLVSYAAVSAVLLIGSQYADQMHTELLWIWVSISLMVYMSAALTLLIVLRRKIHWNRFRRKTGSAQSQRSEVGVNRL